jgi:iron complex transport system substrate-binding protein
MNMIKLGALAVVGILALANLAHAQETRLFVDDQGHEVTIPVTPQRIVSLRGEQFTAPLYELGANLVGSSGLVNEAVNGGLPYVRGAYDALDFRFEESGVTWVGSPNEHDYEAISAVEPDLIIVPDFAADDYDRLALIAPTVVLQVWGQDMLDMYAKVADLADREAEFERLSARYAERLERARQTLADTIGDPAAISVAVASAFEDRIAVYRDYGTLGQVLRDLGFSMPAVIAEMEDANADLSLELMPQIDADFMIDTYWTARGQSPTQKLDAWDAAMPGWREVLHAGRHNQVFMINREEMRAVSFQALRSVLDIVISQIGTRDFVALPRN